MLTLFIKQPLGQPIHKLLLSEKNGESSSLLVAAFDFETLRAGWDVSKIPASPYLVCNEEVTCYLLILPFSIMDKVELKGGEVSL